MVHVAGLWELGWNTPIKEIELWEYLLRDFAVDSFYMAPITGIRSRRVKERKSLEEILIECSGLPAVFVDERGQTDLQEFSHPQDCLYVFGKVTFSPLLSLMRPGDQSLRVSTVENKGTPWPHQICAIVLYDRLVKNGIDSYR